MVSINKIEEIATVINEAIDKLKGLISDLKELGKPLDKLAWAREEGSHLLDKHSSKDRSRDLDLDPLSVEQNNR